MNLWKRKKDAKALTSVALIVLIAILMVSASSVVVLLYSGSQPDHPASEVVVNGSVVKVNYIGKLDDGRVFDTSLWDVASNDAMYPKSLSFNLRAQSAYTPLQFTVGAGTMITGFDQGVLGMAVGETKVITVPPDEGYGDMNYSRIFTAPLLELMPVYDTTNYTIFYSLYSEVPKAGMVVQDPFYGWDILVISADYKSDMVLLMNKPQVGQKLAVYGEPDATPSTGWYAEVVSIDSGADGGNGIIQVRNLLTSDDAGMVEGYDLNLGMTFYVDMVDESAGTFRMNYNGELLGKTLYFTVTLLEIE
ncbi:MAG: FKBP-type peptidyl-prolyl cis-trans isomerase [Methanomassiliicoccales archaeon]|jgi:FKBP-type peptidyl-prolyl cis-trans isomerase 2|nr:FKBP-type peptidyl-prolyl cis-trans isomerase [Methanomassiliicoccales archaeon]MDD1755763.1 FKBP-type peptidyl-prolyl cis-trans isomerase [Methanomassiliicoccales archaeon]